MKLPYGNADFYQLITENYCYIDRTDRISRLESEGKSLLFLRPRRFGKSLFLSTLENYYDIAKANAFERLFGSLAIGQSPTPLHNQYLILRWDFSMVAPRHTYEQQLQVLTDYLNGEIKAFAGKYSAWLEGTVEIDRSNAAASFRSALDLVQKSGQKLYLLIDEYDNFANEVLMGGHPNSQERYEALVFGEGDFKSVFKTIKGAMAGLGLDRVFIVGVSPLVLHDVSSGFNVAKNIYLRREFNDLCGFNETEVSALLRQVASSCQWSNEQYDETLELMRTYYNGSLFSDDFDKVGEQDRIYNPTATFYLLDALQRTAQYPRKLMDSNLAPDYLKLEYVSQLPGGERVIMTALDEQTPLSVIDLEERFGVLQLLATSQTDDFMASLLYYLGVLTLDGETDDGRLILRVPNLIMRSLYAERLLDLFLPDNRVKNDAAQVARTLYSQGEMSPLCEFIEQQIFPVFDNRDYLQVNELAIKTAFLTLLFNDTFYIMDSEAELQRSYADLTMILRPEMRRFTLLDILLEFKLVKLSELGLSGQQVRQMSREELPNLKLVNTQLQEAIEQAQHYRTVLTTKYADKLRLRTYAVVAIGFERLVWQEVMN